MFAFSQYWSSAFMIKERNQELFNLRVIFEFETVKINTFTQNFKAVVLQHDDLGYGDLFTNSTLCLFVISAKHFDWNVGKTCFY